MLFRSRCFACRDLLAERKRIRDEATAKRREETKEERRVKRKAYNRERYLKNAPPKKPRVKVDRKIAERRSAMKRAIAVERATPSWSSLKPFFDTIDLTKLAEESTDHTIPLQHKLVCGLNIPANLERVSRLKNQKKRNYFNPDEWVYLKEEFRFIRIECEDAPDYGIE